VKPYIRRQKNDAADEAAICEAVTRPSMRFVGVRSLENQAALMRHKAREMLVSQRTLRGSAPEQPPRGVPIFMRCLCRPPMSCIELLSPSDAK
jgi:hypothetical protein